MAQVWKFRVPAPATPWVEMPTGSTLLHVAEQDGVPYLWALVNPLAALVRRHVVTYGTGWPIDDGPTYLGTVHIEWIVWHVFYTAAEVPLPVSEQVA